eukprot:c16577_g1_i1.p1 GENE.c16577_g1_i1~~c16577_g1_i1.p1  ORF type:complete len:443 (-),score=173.32 c16577_g1_i1:45-1373(-)
MDYNGTLDLSEYNLSNDGRKWKSSTENGFTPNWSYFASSTTEFEYPGSGFVIDIPLGNYTIASNILNEIKSSDWIDKNTRALFIESTIFNQNVDSLLSLLLLLEIPPTGAATCYSNYIPLVTDKYDFQSGAIDFLLELVFLGMAVVFLLVEIKEFYLIWSDKQNAHKRFIVVFWSYLTGDWNSIDIINIFILFVWQMIRLSNSTLTNELATSLTHYNVTPDLSSNGRFEYFNSASLAALTVLEWYWVSIVMTLYWLKLVKYAVLAPDVGPVVSALVNTMFDNNVLIFIVVLALAVVSFSIGHSVAFGQDSINYHTISSSVLNLILATSGSSDTSFFDVSPRFGPILTIIVNLVLGKVLINIFIAVVSDVYNCVLENAQEDWEQDLTDRMIDNINTRSEKRKLVRKIMSLGKVEDEIDDEEEVKLDWDEYVVQKFDSYSKQIK